ncbi:MAG: hypothetical protein LC750_16775 [Actinobacteria bacterium]|nr:hypothetical protein [Actinomycetota bacterium]
MHWWIDVALLSVIALLLFYVAALLDQNRKLRLELDDIMRNVYKRLARERQYYDPPA